MATKAYTFRYGVRSWRVYNQALVAGSEIDFFIGWLK